MTASPVVARPTSVGSCAQPFDLSRLDTISLPELTDLAGLDTRIDRKYIVDAEHLDLLLGGLGERLRVLMIDGQIDFSYESSYFDTPELDAYLGSAQSVADRLKVRTRTYLDLAATKIEVKIQDISGITRKLRQDHPFEMRRQLTEDSRWFVESISPRRGHAALLVPALTTSYRRTTLVEERSGSRLTVDAGLLCSDTNGAAVGIPGHFIVEVKSPYGFGHMDQWLWRHSIEPVKVSKFGTGLAALNPDLPSEKWTDIIDRYFRRVKDVV